MASRLAQEEMGRGRDDVAALLRPERVIKRFIALMPVRSSKVSALTETTHQAQALPTILESILDSNR